MVGGERGSDGVVLSWMHQLLIDGIALLRGVYMARASRVNAARQRLTVTASMHAAIEALGSLADAHPFIQYDVHL